MVNRMTYGRLTPCLVANLMNFGWPISCTKVRPSV